MVMLGNRNARPASRLLSVCTLAGLAGAAGAQGITAIALTGQQAPGVEAGVGFARLSPPALAADGSVVFFATLAGDGLSADLDEGLFSFDAGVGSLIVRESDAAPWYAPDTRFVGLSDFAIDAGGSVVLAASVDDPAVVDAAQKARALGVFTQVAPGVFAALARIDEQAAGLPEGDLYETLDSAAVAPDGSSLFVGGRPGDGLDSAPKGLWSDQTGATMLLLAPGDAAPGTGGLFAHFETPTPVGDGFVIRGSFKPEGSQDRATTGLWRERAGSLDAMALAGNPAPGTTASFTAFAPRVGAGEAAAAFRAELDSADVAVDSGLWTDRAGGLGLLVREGDTAPGAADATIGEISRALSMNGAGDIAFRCALGNTPAGTNTAVYLAQESGWFLLIAREGDTIDDEPGDVRIAGLGDPLVNDAGEMIMPAHLAGVQVTATTNDALLGVDGDGRVYTIVREGDEIDPDGDGARVVRGIVADTSAHERGRDALDNNGRAGFALSFTDGSFGVFTAAIGYASPADITGDGAVNTQDFVAYLNLWANSLPGADFNRDGGIDTQDFIAFLAAWSRDRA
jgi:hypothetical protein